MKLNKIKSIFFIRLLLKDYLEEKIYLELSRYNKKLQKILALSKKYYRGCKNIEIELIPISKEELKQGKNYFIKLYDGYYYHIYFNNDKKQINRDYITSDDQVSKIKVIIESSVKKLSTLFYDCDCLKEINFTRFKRNDITDMSSMFYGCTKLIKLNLSNLNTENVTEMNEMFYQCESLKELNLSNFDTENVRDMEDMFNGCEALEKLDLSNFAIINVRNMKNMFNGCVSLIDLDISHFHSNKIIYMKGMFSGCSEKLKTKIKKQNHEIKQNAF